MKRYLIILIFFAYSCAVIENPSGGPKDTVPPSILFSKPQNNTVLFKDKKIELQFSEYVNKLTVQQNIYFTPAVEYKTSWVRKKLIVQLLDELNPSLTYTLMLGTDYTDMQGNKPNSAFSLIFSRGNKIDSGIIYGQVFEPKEQSYIYAYKLDGIKADTLNISNKVPDYMIPLGKTGEFSINALKDGDYRLFAIEDKFKDGKYDINNDGFSTATRDFKVENAKSAKAILRAGKIIDKIPPMVNSVTSLSDNLFQIQMSEKIDEGFLSAEFIRIVEPSSKEQVKNIKFFPSSKSAEEFYIFTPTALDTNIYYELVFSNLIIDSAGNSIPDSTSKIKIEPRKSETRFIPNPDYIVCAKDKGEIWADEVFEINFNYPIISDSIGKVFKIISKIDSTEKKLKIQKSLFGNKFKLLPQNLENSKEYILQINTRGIKSILGDNAKDTIYTKELITLNPMEVSSVSGLIETNTYFSGSLLIKLFNKTNTYQTKTDSKGNWKFERVVPGDYSVVVYEDINGNGILDNGYPFPYVSAEISFSIGKMISVKKGWGTDNIKLNINK